MIQQEIPQEIIDVANSAALFDKVTEAMQPYNLHINQIGELDSIIRQALKGLLPREDIMRHIVQNLEVDNITANKLLKTINIEIFQKLRELVLQTHQEIEEGAVEETLAHIEDPRGAVASSSGTRIPINILTKASPHDLAQIPGEVAHNVPHIEQPAEAPASKQANPLQSLSTPKHNPMESEVLQAKTPQDMRGYTGIDPYREPLK